MTRNGSFERRVRARMAETAETHDAVRRTTIDQAEDPDDRGWVSQPEHTDEAIVTNTGRSWDQWRELIDTWPRHDAGHREVAAWLQREHDVDGWWAQAITVGWERITGRRLPSQMADGTFTANKSATITTDHDALRQMLLDAVGRADLFPGLETELRSRPTSKNIRIGLEQGVAEINLAPKGDGRATITVAHTKLTSPRDMKHWKAFWNDWLAALDD